MTKNEAIKLLASTQALDESTLKEIREAIANDAVTTTVAPVTPSTDEDEYSNSDEGYSSSDEDEYSSSDDSWENSNCQLYMDLFSQFQWPGAAFAIAASVFAIAWVIVTASEEINK